jgi:hypothetical protein
MTSSVSPSIVPPSYDDSVFINCPFDKQYLNLLHAILFTVHDCGFVARHALEDVGGRESRLDKICRIVQESRWSIHDISRVQLSRGSGLPRFNMPFECGLAYGAMRFGQTTDRDVLVMAAVQFQDKASLSDLAGIDPAYHGNDVGQVIAGVRRFLSRKRKAVRMRSHEDIARRLRKFEAALPLALRGKSTKLATMRSLDYVNDWVVLAAEWMTLNPKA